jgi:hypothetical protein
MFDPNNDFQTVQYGGALEKLLAKHGITNNATVALGPATIDYLLGIKPHGGAAAKPKPKGKVTINFNAGFHT